jgi:hypothetical protein
MRDRGTGFLRAQSPKSRVQGGAGLRGYLGPWTLDLGRRQGFAVLVLFVTALPAFAASRPAAEQAKIDWLLAEIGNSKATFIRNGNEYDASKAVSHLKTKLLFAGRRVQTVRQFVVGVASHSEETGKPYEIRGQDGKQGPMETWLLERLAVYEKGAASQRPPVLPPPAPKPSPPGRGKG